MSLVLLFFLDGWRLGVCRQTAVYTTDITVLLSWGFAAFYFVRVECIRGEEKRDNRQQVASRLLWGQHTIDIQLLRLALYLKFTLQKINKT